MTKCHRWGGLHKRHFGGLKSEIKVLAGLVSPAASPGLVDEMAAFLLHPHVPPRPPSFYVFISPSCKDFSQSRSRTTTMTSF